jgi:hypothetical protein
MIGWTGSRRFQREKKNRAINARGKGVKREMNTVKF